MKGFETGKGRRAGPRKVPLGLFARYRPQIVVCALVVLVLAGGAYYSSRASESAPRVVYSMSLEEARVDAQTPLLVDLKTADAEELDELPGVGPSTAEAMIEHRRINGSFDTVEELAQWTNCKPIGHQLRVQMTEVDTGDWSWREVEGRRRA